MRPIVPRKRTSDDVTVTRRTSPADSSDLGVKPGGVWQQTKRPLGKRSNGK